MIVDWVALFYDDGLSCLTWVHALSLLILVASVVITVVSTAVVVFFFMLAFLVHWTVVVVFCVGCSRGEWCYCIFTISICSNNWYTNKGIINEISLTFLLAFSGRKTCIVFAASFRFQSTFDSLVFVVLRWFVVISLSSWRFWASAAFVRAIILAVVISSGSLSAIWSGWSSLSAVWSAHFSSAVASWSTSSATTTRITSASKSAAN